MKIRTLELNNYKRFRREGQPFVFDFFNKGTNQVNDITVITGMNGDGKTSLLQAIAFLIADAVYNDFAPNKLNWPGFHYDYIQNGEKPLELRAEIELSPEEATATRSFASELDQRYDTTTLFPIDDQKGQVTLLFDPREGRTYPSIADSPKGLSLLKGYQFAAQLAKHDSNPTNRFEQVGTVLWYHEQRTTDFSSIAQVLLADEGEDTSTSLKRIVADWYYAHRDIDTGITQLRGGQHDKFKKLKTLYESIFRDRKLSHVTLKKGGGNGVDVILKDGHNDYDLSEMSAGERAIFPMLFDFANRNINNSIILIDELELHLHPPLQLQLLRALPKLGQNNQFIVTTHSNYIASEFSEDAKIVMSHE